jgi:phosphate-selective porin OprO and OprP
MRQGGQLGNDLYSNPSIRTFAADALLKYNGWAWYNEYIHRGSNNPVTANAADPTKTRFVYVGEGFLSQLSYLFKNNFEVAARYSTVRPSTPLYDNETFTSLREKTIEQVEAGVTKYLVGHRVKIQGNVIYNNQTNSLDNSWADGYWSAIFQVELGI